MENNPDYYWPEKILPDGQAMDAIDNFFLSKEKYVKSYQQECPVCHRRFNPLILKGSSGERLLTVPGANEKDFAFFGCCPGTFEGFTAYLINALSDSKADHLKIPLLDGKTADDLIAKLKGSGMDFVFHKNLSNIVPVISKKEKFKLSDSLRKAVRLVEKNGWTVEVLDKIPAEIKELHSKKWGRNRNDDFFDFLDLMLSKDIAICHSIKNDNKFSAISIDIKTSNAYHLYYSLYDHEGGAGAGTSTIGLLYEQFIKNEKVDYFSFGRGSERYKFLYANRYYPLYEIRGFYVPRNKQ